MNEEFDKMIAAAEKAQDRVAQVIEKLFDVAQPGAVYGEPITVGERTLITASEVTVGMGFGLGSGGGSGRDSIQPEAAEAEGETAFEDEGIGLGGGGGGGGGSSARPVAVISIGPRGVQVEPVVDPTKIAIALFTTLGSMAFMLSRMRKGR